ncbi:MAG: type I-MYXAN CRISPR-associated protein Cas6/Cmx6 [Proteobacteria bacterium]|nr:type I-MYXAN CRISPR-associated protein Cas6/Cmx6 [Pseudomonadota bacterium]
MTTTTQTLTSHVDAAFSLRGQTIPMDHGYALFAALSRHLPELHRHEDWLVHPVLGQGHRDGILTLFDRSRVRLRLPSQELGQLLPLVQKTLDIAGHACTLGFPKIYPLRPAPYLQSRLVIIKGCTDSPAQFADAVRRQIARLPGLGQDPERIELQIGPRRILRIKRVTIAGYPVALSGLEADASIAVQSAGLGGRHHMGAGVFVPPRRSA